jgi:hypothetical protein
MANNSTVRDANTFAEAKKKEFFDLVAEWHKAKASLDAATAEESRIRLLLCDKKFFPDPVEGATNKIVLGFGKALVLDYRINRKLDEAALDAKVMAGELKPEDVSAAVKYKAEVWDSGWKKLDSETRKKFADIVTETPGKPGLKIDKAPTR